MAKVTRDVFEQRRVEAVRRYWSLAMASASALNDITQLASRISDAPIVMLSFVDEEKILFSCTRGIEGSETKRSGSFCGHVVKEHQPLFVPDTLVDERFKNNIFVTNPPHIRSYIGAPLISPDGFAVGTLCALDTKPKIFSESLIEVMTVLARQAMSLLEAEHSREMLIKSETRYRRLFDSMTDPFAEADMKGNLINVNPAYCEMTGYSADELHEMTYYDLTPDKWHEFESRIIDEQLLVRGDTDVYQKEYIHKDGHVFPVELKAFLLRNDQGVPTGIWANVRDISERREAELKLIRSEEKLIEAQRLAKVGNWELDIQTNRLEWSDEIFRIFEIDPEKFAASYEAFLEAIHPDDREAVNEAYQNSLRDRTSYHITHRLLMKDGRIKWVEEQCVNYFDEAGKPIRSIGAVQDVTESKSAEERLRESRAYLHAIFDNEPECIKLIDVHGNLCDMNSAGIAMVEAESLEMIQSVNLIGLILPEYREAFTKCVQDVFRGQRVRLEYEIVGLKGTHRWLEQHAVPLLDPVDPTKVTHLLGVSRDVTTRKLAEAALSESEERLRLAVDAADLGLYDLNLVTGDALVSDRYATMLGYDPAEFKETNLAWRERLHPDDEEKVYNVFTDYVAGKLPEYRVEFRQKTKSGEWKWILSHGKIVEWDLDGKPLRMLGTHADITRQKIDEMAVLESEHRYRRLFHEAPVGHALIRMSDGKFLEINQAFADITGYEIEELNDLTYWQLTPEEYADQEALQLESLNKTGRYGPYEKDYIRKDGSRVAIRLNGALVKDRVGEPLIISVVEDITDIKLAEAALRASEERYRVQVDHAPDAIVVFDIDLNRFIDCNRNAEVMFGMSRAELLKSSPGQLSPAIQPGGKFSADLARQKTLDALEGETPVFEWIHCNSEGVEFPCEVRLVRMPSEGKKVVRGSILDITERRRTEQALRLSEQRYRSVVNSLSEAVMLFDTHGNIIACNPSAEQISGMTAAELLSNVANDPTWTFVDKNGEPLESSETPVYITLTTGNEVEGFVMGMRRYDGDITWISSNSQPIFDPEDSSLKAVVCSYFDITALKKVEEERKRLNEELERRVAERTSQLDEKNKDLELFSYAISHDLRAPLRAILGYTALLKEDYDKVLDEEGAGLLERLVVNGERMSEMLDGILTYSRIGTRTSTAMKVDVGDFLRSMVHEIASDGEGAKTEFEWSIEDVTIRVDKNALELCVRNLLENAIKFSAKSEQPKVFVSVRVIEETCAISIQDNGIGFNMAYLDKIFHMFGRLDSSTPGTGVGLALVERATKRMGGAISAESTLGKGSTFILELPIHGMK